MVSARRRTAYGRPRRGNMAHSTSTCRFLECDERNGGFRAGVMAVALDQESVPSQEDAMLELHDFDRSPFGWKTRIVLGEKKVPYEMFVPENKAESATFGKLNPFRLTPVLELEDG